MFEPWRQRFDVVHVRECAACHLVDTINHRAFLSRLAESDFAAVQAVRASNMYKERSCPVQYRLLNATSLIAAVFLP